MKPEFPISETLALARDGDESARERLFQDYRPYLKAICRKRFRKNANTRFDPSDMVQQTCAEILIGLPTFRGGTEPEFTAWITSVLQSKIASEYRFHTQARRDFRREVSRDDDSTAQLEWHMGNSAETDNTMKAVVRGEAALFLAKAISELPEQQGLVISMRYLEDLKLREIAEELSLTIAQVVALCQKGMKMLDNLLPDGLVSDS